MNNYASSIYKDSETFNQESFRNSYTSLSSSDPSLKEIFQWILSQFHDFYTNIGPKLGAARILEYGAGPASIYPLISATPYASEIILAEYAEQNRKVAELWKSKKSQAPDFSDLFMYVLETLEKNQDLNRAEEREATLQALVSQIVPCDITKDVCLDESVRLPFDVVSTQFCLICACSSKEEYAMAIKKLASLLRPGGMIVMTEAIQGSYYMVNGEKTPELTLASNEVVRDSLVKAGFTEISMNSLVPLPTDATDCTEYIFCSGVLSAV
jgi:SAM-dependent methyltransferase